MSRGWLVLSLAAGMLLSGRTAFGADEASRIYLHKGWQIQSSCEAKASGAEISAAGFATKGWHHTDIPGTVVGALVTDKTYPDPNYGTNLKSFPGMDYSSKDFFANQDIGGQDELAEFSWHQLSCERLAQRPKNRGCQ